MCGSVSLHQVVYGRVSVCVRWCMVVSCLVLSGCVCWFWMALGNVQWYWEVSIGV